MQILDSGTDQCTNDPWEYVLPVETCGPGSVLRVDWGDGTADTDYPVDADQSVNISHVFTSTPAGFYQVTASLRDPSGTEQDTFGLLAFILDAPTSGLEAKTNGQCGFPKTCANDGEIFVSALDGGVSPYDLTFSHGPTFSDVAGCSGELGCGIVFSGLSDGTYSLDTVDENGCVATTNSVQLFTSSVSVASVTQPTCGSIDLSASSTCEPLTFAWSTADGSGLNPGAEDQSNLSPGTYDVLITDPNGCTNSASFTLGYGITNVFTDDVFYMYILPTHKRALARAHTLICARCCAYHENRTSDRALGISRVRSAGPTLSAGRLEALGWCAPTRTLSSSTVTSRTQQWPH